MTTTENPTKPDTKELIVTTAFRLFSRQGYRDTSVAQIAREAGLSKGLMYHYFTSKEELLKGIFAHYQSETVHKMDWDSTAPPLENLKKLVDLSFYYLQTQAELRRFSLLLTLQNTVSEDLKAMIATGKKQWEAAFEEIFRFLGYHQPHAEALYLSALLDGVAIRHLATDNYPLSDVKQLINRNYGISPSN